MGIMTDLLQEQTREIATLNESIKATDRREEREKANEKIIEFRLYFFQRMNIYYQDYGAIKALNVFTDSRIKEIVINEIIETGKTEHMDKQYYVLYELYDKELAKLSKQWKTEIKAQPKQPEIKQPTWKRPKQKNKIGLFKIIACIIFLPLVLLFMILQGFSAHERRGRRC